MRPLRLPNTPVDGDHLSIHERGFVADEEDDEPGHFLRPPRPTGQVSLFQRLPDLRRILELLEMPPSALFHLLYTAQRCHSRSNAQTSSKPIRRFMSASGMSG